MPLVCFFRIPPFPTKNSLEIKFSIILKYLPAATSIILRFGYHFNYILLSSFKEYLYFHNFDQTKLNKKAILVTISQGGQLNWYDTSNVYFISQACFIRPTFGYIPQYPKHISYIEQSLNIGGPYYGKSFSAFMNI